MFGGVGAVVWVISAGIAGRARHRELLARLARALEGQATTNGVTSKRNGVAVAVRFVTRGSSSNMEWWTEVDAELPAGYPFTLGLRRHRRQDAEQIASGQMVDVQIGHADFDRVFLIEGAPDDVVKRVLEGPLLACLAREPEATLDTVRDGERILIRFATRRWLAEPAEVVDVVDAVASAPGRVRAATVEANQGIALAVTDDDPYRPMTSDAPLRAAAEQRARDVERVEQLRANRRSNVGCLVLLLVAMFIFVGMLIAATAH